MSYIDKKQHATSVDEHIAQSLKKQVESINTVVVPIKQEDIIIATLYFDSKDIIDLCDAVSRGSYINLNGSIHIKGFHLPWKSLFSISTLGAAQRENMNILAEMIAFLHQDFLTTFQRLFDNKVIYRSLDGKNEGILQQQLEAIYAVDYMFTQFSKYTSSVITTVWQRLIVGLTFHLCNTYSFGQVIPPIVVNFLQNVQLITRIPYAKDQILIYYINDELHMNSTFILQYDGQRYIRVDQCQDLEELKLALLLQQ